MRTAEDQVGIGTKGPIVWQVARRYELPEDCMSIQEIRFALDKYWPMKFDAPGAMEYNGSHILLKDIAWLSKVNKIQLYHLIDGRIQLGRVQMERLARQLEKVEHGLIVKKFGRIMREKKPTKEPMRFYRGHIDFFISGRPVLQIGRLRQPSLAIVGMPGNLKFNKELK